MVQNKNNNKHTESFIKYFAYFLFRNKTKFLIICLLYSIFFIVLTYIIDNNSKTTYDEKDISRKITAISDNLKETATELSVLQQQLEARIDYVEKLKEEAEIAENVISLSEEQVNAVQSKINQELNANGNKSTIMSFLISALFFVLGLIVQPTINFFKHKKNKHNNHEIDNKQYNQEELLILLNEVKNAIENRDNKSSKIN